MEFILNYYRNPIFSILVLISLVLIVALLQLIFASVKESKTNKNIKKYLDNFKGFEPKYLENLTLSEKTNLANGFYKALMYLECKQVLLNIVKDCPDNKDLLYLLAICDLRLGLLNDAKNTLLKILKSRARDEHSLLCLAYIHFKLNEMNDCCECYKSLCILGDYEKELKFLKNYKDFNTNYEDSVIKIDEKIIKKDNIKQFFLCNNCSYNSVFYTPFCSQCFKCNTMQANLRIKI